MPINGRTTNKLSVAGLSAFKIMRIGIDPVMRRGESADEISYFNVLDYLTRHYHAYWN